MLVVESLYFVASIVCFALVPLSAVAVRNLAGRNSVALAVAFAILGGALFTAGVSFLLMLGQGSM